MDKETMLKILTGSSVITSEFIFSFFPALGNMNWFVGFIVRK